LHGNNLCDVIIARMVSMDAQKIKNKNKQTNQQMQKTILGPAGHTRSW